MNQGSLAFLYVEGLPIPFIFMTPTFLAPKYGIPLLKQANKISVHFLLSRLGKKSMEFGGKEEAWCTYNAHMSVCLLGRA